MENILAIAEEDLSTTKAPMELSVDDLMMESAMNAVGVSSDKSEEAKRELEEYIAIMLEKEQEDPFEAVRYAIYKVVPQVMTYREAVLEETADEFRVVNELNNDMLEMQGLYAASNDTTILGHSNTVGVENAYKYFEKAQVNAEKVKGMIDAGILPKGLGNSMLDNLNEIVNSTYDFPTGGDPSLHKHYQATGLFNGLIGAQWMAYSSTNPDNPDDTFYYVREVPEAKYDAWIDNSTDAYKNVSQYLPYASELNDNNTIIQSNLNGYSKKVEADFKFEIEEYGQYLTLLAQIDNSSVKSIQVHVREQRV